MRKEPHVTNKLNPHVLQGYAPTNADRRDAVLARKRQEYIDCLPQYYDISDADRSEDERTMLRQVVSCNPDDVFAHMRLLTGALLLGLSCSWISRVDWSCSVLSYPQQLLCSVSDILL